MKTLLIIASVVFTTDGFVFCKFPRFPPAARDISTREIVTDLKSQDKLTREKCGWYDLIENPPRCDVGYYPRASGYRRTAEGYERVYSVEPVVPEVVKYSTLSICRELRNLGKWDSVKSLLTQGGVWDDYYLANYLASSDPVFSSALKAVVEAGILTKAQLDELLPKCVWTAD